MAELNTPLTLGDLHLKNRVIMAPLTRSRATADRVPTAMMAEYYAQRASAGLIISEATVISEEANGYLNCGAVVACGSCIASRFTQR